MSDSQFVETEISKSMSDQIADHVSTIRAIETQIARVKEETGIVDQEEQIKALRAELLVVVKEYHDYTGSNWSDGTNRVLYVQPGESHKFKVEKVDEALSALLGVQRDMDSVLNDNPSQFIIPLGEEKVRVGMDDLDALDKPALLAFIRKLDETRLVAHRELALRVEAMDEILKNLAAARSVTPTVEHVRITKGVGDGE